MEPLRKSNGIGGDGSPRGATDSPAGGVESGAAADTRKARAGGSTEIAPVVLGKFMLYVAERFSRDSCQQRAASLTFTALLAMVPLLAVSFAIFSAFPAFENLKGEFQTFLFTRFVPEVGSEVLSYIERFTAQTGKLTAVGVVFLALSAVMLLMTISSTFNYIWQTRASRGLVSRLLVYWAVLTLTPMLFGASFTLTSYLHAVAKSTGVETVTGSFTNFAFALPFVMQAMGLAILYLVMPAFPVRRRDAVLGGLVASLLLEGLKKGFQLYVTAFPTYETIYGAMATVPIFLLWVYMCWMVVLFGAEMTASLPEWRAGARSARRSGLTPIRRLSAALAVLYSLSQAHRKGLSLDDRKLAAAARLGPESLGFATKQLRKHGYIARTDRSGWVLARDLREVSLRDLKRDLDLGLSAALPSAHAGKPWAPRLSRLIADAETEDRDKFSMTLEDILAPPAEGEMPDLGEVEDPEAERKARKSFNARVLALIGLGTFGHAG